MNLTDFVGVWEGPAYDVTAVKASLWCGSIRVKRNMNEQVSNDPQININKHNQQAFRTCFFLNI